MASFSAFQLRLQAETIRSCIRLGQDGSFSTPEPPLPPFLATFLANNPPFSAVISSTPVSAVYTTKTVTQSTSSTTSSVHQPKPKIPLQPPVLAVAEGISGSLSRVATATSSPLVLAVATAKTCHSATSSAIYTHGHTRGYIPLRPPPVLAVAKTACTSPPHLFLLRPPLIFFHAFFFAGLQPTTG